LNIPLYVKLDRTSNGAEKSEQQSLATAIEEWQDSSQALCTSMNDLFTVLEEAGFGA